MASEVKFFFPIFFCDLIYACLCGSLALVLQYKDKVPQRDGMKRLFEVISKPGLIRLQTEAVNTNVFLPLLWIPLLFPDAGGTADVEMASQNPGTSSFTAGEGCSRGQGGGGVGGGESVCIRGRKCQLIDVQLRVSPQLGLIKDPSWSVLLAAEE